MVKSDEVCVALVGATVAISVALGVLSTIPKLGTTNEVQTFEELNIETNDLGIRTRLPYQQPEIRTGKTLQPFNHILPDGSILSPDKVVEYREPMLLRNWAHQFGLESVMLWTEESLIEAFQGWGLRNVRGQLKSPIFKLSTQSEVDIFDGLPMSDFFEFANDITAPYCYYTASLLEWDPIGTLGNDTTGWHNLAVKEVQDDDETNRNEEENLSMAMLWLSHPSVTAHPHFDKSQNFLTQVIGSKRVLLWPPEQTPFLYPHQERDEFRKQSKVDMSAPDFVKYPKFIRASAISVDLNPGDTLYIPPFWWHRISASSSSLSLSVVSPSKVEAILAAANYVPLPFLRRNATKHNAYLKHTRLTDVEPEVRVVAVQVFMGHLLSRLSRGHLKHMTPNYVSSLVRETLYEPHLDTSAAGLLVSREDLNLLSLCDAGSGHSHVHVSKHQKLLEKLPKVPLIKAANQVVDIILELQHYDERHGVLEWWLMEYIDDLSRWSLGAHSASNNVNLLNEFVDRCIGSITQLPKPVQPHEEWEEGGTLHILDEEEKDDDEVVEMI